MNVVAAFAPFFERDIFLVIDGFSLSTSFGFFC